jgi:hypothetical protein
MDFTNRGQQFQPNTDNNETKQPEPQQHNNNKQPKRSLSLPHHSKLLKVFQVGLLTCVAVLLIGILLSVATYKEKGEDRYVDASKYQAVFLNGGQVYFGKITALNNDYLTLSNIYYLRVNQQVQPGQENQENNFTLAKLGCELHRPQDIMLINKEQVIFWENLKDEDGANTVPGAIKSHLESTNGVQNCEENQQPQPNSDASNEAAPTEDNEEAPNTEADDSAANNSSPTTPERSAPEDDNPAGNQ